MVQRLQQFYQEKVVPQLTEQFQYTNKHQVPALEKIVINRGVGDASQNSKLIDASLKEIAVIAGQKGIITRSKKSIAGFKIREGMPLGLTVTLRREKMYAFLERFIKLTLPRIRDFRGLSPTTFDKHGNFYICEGLGQRVRKVSLTGIISRVAGTGSSGASGDGGAATSAQLNTPTDVALDTFGNIYISALNNFKVRKVNAITGVINTVVGTGTAGYNGDGILATTAQIQGNEQIWVDVAGNIFICDRDNFRVRKVNTSGIISTVAGGNFSGTGTGDGGLATAATFNMITGVAVDKNGNIFIADYNAAKVRKVDSAGIISTIAGNGTPSYIGDNIPATAAQIAPLRLTFDTSMNLVIADKYNHRIFKIDNFGIIHCIAGNGASGFTADGALATAASLDFPAGISYDPCGNLYIAEAINKRVRKVLFNPTCSIASLNTEIASIQENISIFPNPVGDELQIQNVQTKTEYKLCNAVGALLQSGFLKQDNNTISLKYLPLGMYMLVLTDEEGRKTIKKIVKD